MKYYIGLLNIYDEGNTNTMQFDESKINSTLGETSKDDNSGEYVIKSDQKVLDFDEITREIGGLYRNKRPLASCDALHIKNDEHIYLIEFKNARKSRIGKKFFCQKAFDSPLTLAFAFYPGLSLKELSERVYLIVVYNDDGVVEKEQESIHFEKFKNKMESLSMQEHRILFGLEIYRGILYKEIFTVEKEDFMKQIYKEIF